MLGSWALQAHMPGLLARATRGRNPLLGDMVVSKVVLVVVKLVDMMVVMAFCKAR